MTHNRRNSFIPGKETLRKILHSFNHKQMVIFSVLAIIMTVSAISMVGKINNKFLIKQPTFGGSFTEGVVGSPRFINPILATSDTDKDLSSLIYSGLLKKMPDGTFVNDLAESYQVSDDKLTYTFTIKENAKFQDKTPLTADDIIFTVEEIKDSLIKSPLQALWQGVSVSKGDASNVVIFRLSKAYASFFDNLTVGILPKHIWENLSPEEFNFTNLNLEAVGSGPYRIQSMDEKKSGGIEEIKLTAFSLYASEKPFIKNIKFKFVAGEDELVRALKRGSVDQVGAISPKGAFELKQAGYAPTTATLSRVFGIFLNPNKNEIFRNKNIVHALELGIDKQKIVDTVLFGFGEPINSPIPKSLGGTNTDVEASNIQEAGDLLEREGYKVNGSTGLREKNGSPLAFSISTADVSELREAANIIKENLANIGVTVSVKVFDLGMLNQTIIRPRDYESVLFGQVIRNESDLFAFWHSSQRNDPGLNIALYTNNQVDKTLEELISATDETTKRAKMIEFDTQIQKDLPALFLYSPDFIYLESEKVKNITLGRLSGASDRFNDIEHWYIRTNSVYSFFIKNKNTNETN